MRRFVASLTVVLIATAAAAQNAVVTRNVNLRAGSARFGPTRKRRRV